jgi:lysophospholipase L1-like esterase
MDKKPLYKEILNSLRLGNEYKISFIGDSLTSAEWVHPNWRETLEYILKYSFEEFQNDDWWIPEWNLKFYNYALDGASTKEFERQVMIAKEQVNPDLFIIMGTSNDIELDISINDHVKNLKRIFELIKTKGTIFSPDVYSNDERLNSIYKDYVKAVLSVIPQYMTTINGFEIFRNYPIHNFYTLNLDEKYDKGNERLKDLLHPNVLGNIYIAKMILEEGFGIDVKPEKYLEDIRSDTVKYPKWK